MSTELGKVESRSTEDLIAEIEELGRRLEATESILHAMQNAQVDALLVPHDGAKPVYAITGGDLRYRLLLDALNAGAVILAENRTLLYANRGFAELLAHPFDELAGASFTRFVDPQDRAVLAALEQPETDELQATLHLLRGNGSSVRVRLSLRSISFQGARCFAGLVLRMAPAVQEPPDSRSDASGNRHDPGEQLFRLAVDNFPGVFIIYDAERRIQFINVPGVILSGLPEKALLGHRDEEVFPPEVTGSLLPLLQRAIASGTVQTGEVQVTWPAGTFSEHVTYVPLLDDEGEIQQVLGVAEDITERKRAEEALRRLNAELEQRVADRTAELESINQRLKDEIVEHAHTEAALRKSEERFRLLAENAQDLIFRINLVPERRFEYVSPSALALSGYTPAEYYADPDLGFTLVVPEDRPLFEAAMRGDVAPGTPLILRLVRRDATSIWTEQRLTPIYSQAGDLIALEGIARDITERKQAGEALRLSEERFRIALKNAPITVFSQDRDLRYTWFYIPSAARDTDWLLGRNDADVLPPDEAERLAEIKRGVMETGLGAHQEGWLTLHGERRYFDFTVEPLRDAEGSITGVTTVAVNITERKRAEDALEHANENLVIWANELEQRNREMGSLNEMGNLLESCLTAEEAYQVIAHSARILFPNDSGALYVINASRNLMEVVASWGDGSAAALEQVFSPDECWSIRRGRTHVVEHSGVGLLCSHVHRNLRNGSPPFAYLCVPMLAQNEVLGVFFLQSAVVDSEQSRREPGGLTEAKERLAVSIGEHVALALSSLRLRETLRHQAIRDPLTGLFNRRYMEESLERELRRASRREGKVGIIMLDLDHFKHFNDAFGHEVGDTILRSFGEFLGAHIRGGDIACRYGGEEFTLILPETLMTETYERAEQLRQEIKRLTVEWNDHTFGSLSASLGVAIYPDHGQTAEAILRAADSALYRAKEAGRDRVVLVEGGS